MLNGDRWISKLDNPTMVGNLPLKSWESSGSSTGNGVNGDAWAFYYFDIYGAVHSGGTKATQLSFTSGPTGPSQPMKWTSPGMLLPRRKTLAWSEGVAEFDLWYDSRDVTTDYVPVTDRAKVQLDDKVLLVPVHVIELSNNLTPWKKNWVGADTGQPSADWVAALLDNRQTETVGRTTNPSYSPQTVTHEWRQQEVRRPGRPDLIFTQCDIQFRLVKFTSCVVDASVLAPPEGPLSCGYTPAVGMQGKVLDAVSKCISEKDGGVQLIFTGLLDSGDFCIEKTLGITTKGSTQSIVTANGSYRKHVITHELGHMLNLGHVVDSTRLMHEKLEFPAGETLSAAECETARTSALAKQAQWP